MILDKINSPEDLRRLDIEELRPLCGEIRDYIVRCCADNPGHLASSLGAVELIVGLHYVFDTPKDKLVFDVGHQAYAHKILTGRKEAFKKNRMPDGISGFPNRDESEYDAFGAGHASTSISAALGMAEAAKLSGTGEKVVAMIGDGAMTGGLALEGLNNAGWEDTVETSEEDKFRFSDVVKLLKNKHFIVIALLCVFFYSSVVSFKKFASSILIPRFDVPVEAASWMVSMLPFATVVFAPIFGLLVDKIGHGTRWMLTGAVLALIAHLMLAFAPSGIPFYGYLSMVFLGFGYSLVPAAMWPSVPKIVPNKVLGTAYSLIYWVQNLGLMSFKMFAGKILADTNLDKGVSEAGAFWVEVMFVAVCVVALLLALSLSVYSRRNPHLKMDVPDRAVK
jgi:Na+/melibiose symporter-like transporter